MRLQEARQQTTPDRPRPINPSSNAFRATQSSRRNELGAVVGYGKTLAMLPSGQCGGCLMGTVWQNIADRVLLPITNSCGEWLDKRRLWSLRRSLGASSSPDSSRSS